MLPFVRILVAAFLALAVLYGLARLIVHHMIFPGCPVAFPRPDELAASGLQARLLKYTVGAGVDLEAAWFSPTLRSPPGEAAPSSPTVIFFHGNGESAAQNFDLAEALVHRGIGVLLAEYRGYGGMPGRPSERVVTADAERALELLEHCGVRPERLVLIGRSLGTGVAVALAVRHRPALLILVSPYTSLVDLGRRIAGPLAPFLTSDRFDTTSRIQKVTCPIVIIHGTADEVVPYEMGERLARMASASLIPLVGRNHNDLGDLPEIFARIIGERLGR
jgi:uncharacterized protein